MELNVLIIDDDDVFLFLHKKFAQTSGFAAEAILCKSGNVALEVLKMNDDVNITFLLLLDINMPDMDGWELLNAIGQHNFKAQIFVVILTSSINASDREKASKYKLVIHFCTKPITVQDLTELKKLNQLKQFFK